MNTPFSLPLLRVAVSVRSAGRHVRAFDRGLIRITDLVRLASTRTNALTWRRSHLLTPPGAEAAGGLYRRFPLYWRSRNRN